MDWYQLTYASSESSFGRTGGWDVQQVTGGVPQGVEAVLRDGVTTRLEAPDTHDEFSTTAELGARTRRLAFRYVDDVGLAWWHSVDAGKDATGRPGNVFTHAVVLGDGPDRVRPISLWRSPSWLAPFGQKEVASIELSDIRLDDEPLRTVALARAFARQYETEALLCAVSTCLEHGWSLIVTAESQDEFAEWVSVVSYLTAANVAVGLLSFSSFERAARLPQGADGYAVIGIPRVDLKSALTKARQPGPTRMLVLDLDDLPKRSVEGQWEYAGQRWPAQGLWQEAFFELTDTDRYGADRVRDVLDLMDDVTQDGDNVDDIGAPLAAALLSDCPDESVRDAMLGQWEARLGVRVNALSKLLQTGRPLDVARLDVKEVVAPGRHRSEPMPAPRAFLVEEPTLSQTTYGTSHAHADLSVRLPDPQDGNDTHLQLVIALMAASDTLTTSSAIARAQLKQWATSYHEARVSTPGTENTKTVD